MKHIVYQTRKSEFDKRTLDTEINEIDKLEKEKLLEKDKWFFSDFTSHNNTTIEEDRYPSSKSTIDSLNCIW